MSVDTLLKTMDSKEISEWMAFDKTCDESWQKEHERQKELELSRQMSDEDRLKAFKALLGGL